MKREKIKTKEPFEGLFPVENHILNAVKEDMKANGYDPNFPVTIWKGKNLCIDGHTRLMAAEVTKINDVPVFARDFPDEDAALQYAIHCQRDRRNMTDADIVRCVEVVDKLKQAGRKSEKELGSSEPNLGRSAETTAKIVGTSASKVKKVRTINAHADEETKAAVDAGTKSIHKAYTETQKKRKPKPVDYSDSEIALQNHFENLEKGCEELRDDIIGFEMNCRGKKRLWKKYLPELHELTGSLHAHTKMWLERLQKEKVDKQKES